MRANHAFYEIFDMKVRGLEGIYFPELDFPLTSNVQMQENIMQLPETGHIDEEIEWNFPGSNKRMLRITGKFLDDQSPKKRILLLFHDITREKESAQQREDLINFVSHELRNPLANLALVVELLPDVLKNNNEDEATDYLEKAKANMRRLKQVISELHDATRAGTGHLSIQKSSFDLSAMIREAIDTVKMLYPRHQVIFSSEMDHTLYADRFRLIQVLNNYLTNAMKYSEGSGKILVDVLHANNKITVSVTDYGPGIPADQLPYVFHKYYRGRSTVKIDGLGLGLYVCSEIILAHGGEVWATSEEGQGSTFYFSVPL
jgi:signal transduction histidine kinase